MNKLSKDEFIKLIRDTKLLSLDFIIFDKDKRKVLLGKRLNKPAQGYYFVPGGRVMVEQGENIDEACIRITKKELGVSIKYDECVRLDKDYIHEYNDNVFDIKDLKTTYTPIGLIFFNDNEYVFKEDDQHEGFKWFDVKEALSMDSVHDYTKDYINDSLKLI